VCYFSMHELYNITDAPTLNYADVVVRRVAVQICLF